MGNVGGILQWREGEYGLQKEDDGCNLEPRDHMRIFGSEFHPTYRYWSVATPHHEQSVVGGHTVDSWMSAQELFAGSWVESDLDNDQRGYDTSVFWWGFESWGNDGTYQDVYFDGMGFIIGADGLPLGCADFDGSGSVAIADLVLLVAHFGDPDPRYDMDGSGTIAIADVVAAVDQFGDECTV